MLNQSTSKKGFTLIEIVIVIVIIAILAAILVPSITSWIDRSKVATIQESVGQIRSALMAQLYDESQKQSIVNTSADDYDDDFWSALSERANTTLQHEDEDGDGYLDFSIGENNIVDITYKSAGHTATYNYENNTWTVD